MKKIAEYQISLKCFLKNKNWEYLILKTPEDSSFYWMYDFVWGRIDEDEFDVDYINILKREIFEEIWLTDVDIENKVVAISRHKALKKFTKSWRDDTIQYIFFSWVINSWNIKISNEHQKYKWVKLNEIILENYFCSWYLDATKMYLWVN